MKSFISIIRHMSKAKKHVTSQATAKVEGPVYYDKSGNILMQIVAKPGAKANGITGFDEEGIGVQINARPVDGEANSELVKYISTVFGLKKNYISLERGIKSRQKVIMISRKDLTPEIIYEKLRAEIS